MKKITNFTQLLEGTLSKEELGLLTTAHDRLGELVLIQIPEGLENKETEIGRAILEFYPTVRAVFKKTGPIGGAFRTRPLKLIAGTGSTETTHKENGCRFKMDISTVYFTGRLSTERERISALVKPGEVIVDMFAGIGPFSILIAKEHQDVEVNCIDINPNAIGYLEENAVLNKVQERVAGFVGDANDFTSQLGSTADRIIMNLPMSKENFFPSALTYLKGKGHIHFYTMAKSEEEVKEFLEKNLEAKYKIIFMRAVRNYSPSEFNFVADIDIEKA